MNCKIIHCSIDPFSEREKQSINQLENLGLRYVRIQNQPYNWPAPQHNMFKNWVGFDHGSDKDPNITGLTDRHYGAWLSHKQAILLSFADDDYSLICECDCRILDVDLFRERLSEAIKVLEENPEYPIVRFEPISFSMNFYDVELGKQISDNIFECKKISLGHCYLINKNSKSFFQKLFDEEGWTTPDDWLLFTFFDRNVPFLCFTENLTSQFDGFSEIDKIIKTF